MVERVSCLFFASIQLPDASARKISAKHLENGSSVVRGYGRILRVALSIRSVQLDRGEKWPQSGSNGREGTGAKVGSLCRARNLSHI